MEMLCFPTARFSPHHPVPHRRHLRATADSVSVRCAEVAVAPMGEKTEYKDGFLEKAFMGLFSRKMEKYASGGVKSKREIWEWDYDSFVDVSRRVMVGRSRQQQQQVVREVLLSMLPPGAPAQFRKLFPPTKWAAEFNATLTVPFFHWLVGPSERLLVAEPERIGLQSDGAHGLTKQKEIPCPSKQSKPFHLIPRSIHDNSKEFSHEACKKGEILELKKKNLEIIFGPAQIVKRFTSSED